MFNQWISGPLPTLCFVKFIAEVQWRTAQTPHEQSNRTDGHEMFHSCVEDSTCYQHAYLPRSLVTGSFNGKGSVLHRSTTNMVHEVTPGIEWQTRRFKRKPVRVVWTSSRNQDLRNVPCPNSNSSYSTSSLSGSHGSWVSIGYPPKQIECISYSAWTCASLWWTFGQWIEVAHRSSPSGSGTGLSRRNRPRFLIFLSVNKGV